VCAGCLALAFAVGLGAAARQSADTASPQAFEAATFKLDRSTGLGNWRILPGGRFTATRVALRGLIRLAYGNDTIVRPREQIVGAPGWIDEDRFTIDAKATSEFTFESPGVSAQAFAMLRTLLEQELKLQARVEQRPMPIYELVVSSKDGTLGPDLTPSSIDCRPKDPPAPADPACAGVGTARAGVAVRGRPIRFLVGFLNINVTAVDRIVVDRTGLDGVFDMRLQWIPPYQFGPGGASVPSPDVDTGPSLQTALQEQLGLKLQPTRAPVDVLVIDHIERAARE
jgi:uncharacterized protein (TIGR03435 family)